MNVNTAFCPNCGATLYLVGGDTLERVLAVHGDVCPNIPRRGYRRVLLAPPRVHAALRYDEDDPSGRYGVSLCGLRIIPDPQVSALVARDDFVRLVLERPKGELCPHCRREVENSRVRQPVRPTPPQ